MRRMIRCICLCCLATLTACDVEDGDDIIDRGTPGADGGLADLGAKSDVFAAPDSAPKARCDRAKPFNRPELVPELDNAGAKFYRVNSAWLDQTERQLLVTARGGSSDGGKLYRLTRDSAVGAFGAPQLIAGIDVDGRSEWSGAMTPDGLSLYFDVARRLPYRATRASTTAPFSEGARIAPALSTKYTRYVDLRPSMRGVYFRRSSDFGGSGLYFMAKGDSTRQSVLVNAAGSISGYSVSSDELTLYYSVSKTTIGQTKLIYRATRPSTSVPFAGGVAFDLEAIVSSSGGVRVAWVSDDECVLYGLIGKKDSYDSYPHDVVLRAFRPL